MDLFKQHDTVKTEDKWQEYRESQRISHFRSENIFPIFFQIQTVTGCNGRCIMCPYTYKKESKNQYMDDELFKKIIKEIAEGQKLIKRGVIVTLMLQNEPFLDKNLIDRIRFVKQFGNLYVNTATNGSLLNEGIVQKLEKSGIDSITISMDSINKKIFEEIRPPFNFDKIMQNIELLKNSSLKDKIRIKMIVQKKNYQEVKRFVRFWKDKGIEPRIFRVTNRCGVLETFKDVKVDDSELKHRFTSSYNKYRTKRIQDSKATHLCSRPFRWFNILFNGDVIKCCHDWEHEDIVGNVQKNTIKEIWDSKLREYRMLFLAGMGSSIPSCKKCSVLGFC